MELGPASLARDLGQRLAGGMHHGVADGTFLRVVELPLHRAQCHVWTAEAATDPAAGPLLTPKLLWLFRRSVSAAISQALTWPCGTPLCLGQAAEAARSG